MHKIIGVTLFVLFIYTPLASTNVEDIGIDLSSLAGLWIDEVPFSIPEEIESNNFEEMAALLEKHVNFDRSNKRYWLRIPPIDLLDSVTEDGYLYFGKFDRIIAFQLNEGEVEATIALGPLYKKNIKEISPHFHLLPTTGLNPNQALYVQLSSGFISNEYLSVLDPYFIPRENLKNFRFQTDFEKTRGIVQLGLLFFLLFIAVTSILYCLIFKSKLLISFSVLCLSLLLFFLRDVEGNYLTSVFWSHFNEGVIRYEILGRIAIYGCFAIFAILHFNFGKYKPLLIKTTSFTVAFGLLTSVYYASLVGPFSHATDTLKVMFGMEMFLSSLNGLAILFAIWKYGESQFSRPFVYSTLLFLVACYSAIGLNTTRLATLQNFFSSKLYASYALILYLVYFAYILIKYIKSEKVNFMLREVENKRLAFAQQTQAKLFSDISHEFRSPLTIINAALEESDANFSKKDIIKKNSDDLLKLANDIRNLSYNPEKLNTPLFVQEDFVSYVRYLVESLETIAEQKNLDLNFHSSHDRYIMDYDEEGIRRIANNLITNAIAFTEDFGLIEISLHFVDNKCSWSILDNGVGIPKENVDKIFDRRFTDHSLVIDSYKGSGIGLSLTKDLVEQMDGTIVCSSEIGKGTLFTIQLPAILQSQINDEDVKPQQKTDDEQPLFFAAEETLILVVEDNHEVQNYIVSGLDKEYNTLTASNGKEALALAKQYIPDLIISDLVMPEVNGYQLIELLKQDQKTDHIPIVLLTGKTGQREKEIGLSYGADAFITKPFSKVELRLVISNILKRVKKLHDKVGSASYKKRQELPDWLKALNDILLNSISDDLSVEELSKQLFLSRTQLHRKLKALTGKSVSQYVKDYKMKEARNMLQNQNNTVTDVAYNLGYKNAGHFATDFKKHVGQSPSDYRNS